MTRPRPLRAQRARSRLTFIDVFVMRRALRHGELPQASAAMLAAADRARAQYRDRRDDILAMMEAAAGAIVNPAAGLVAMTDDDPETRERAARLHRSEAP